MMFTFEYFQGKHITETLIEVKAILNWRDNNNSNAIWIYNEKISYPAIHMLVKDELAVLHYYESDKDTGYRSISKGCFDNDFNLDGNTTFFLLSNGEKQEIWNNMVVTFSVAVEAVFEFVTTHSKPESVEWEEL